MSWNLKSRSILMKGILTLIKLCYGFCWNIMNLQVFDEIQNVCKFWCKLIYKSLPLKLLSQYPKLSFDSPSVVSSKLHDHGCCYKNFFKWQKKCFILNQGCGNIWSEHLFPGKSKWQFYLSEKKITCPDFFVELVLCLTYMLIYWVDLLII